MKEIVVSLLNSLGLGVNASIENSDEFKKRVMELGLFNGFVLNVTPIVVGVFKMSIITADDEITIKYILDGSRVSEINIL